MKEINWQRECENASPLGVIYYVRTCCRIKIGYTNDLETRMRTISPDELLVTEPGGMDKERARHAQFDADRIRGEWFRESPALAAHIRGLRMRHHSAEGTNPGERFIDTANAVRYTGRARQVLYRWATEGRITRYGPPGTALWDVMELPAVRADGITPDPPPMRGDRDHNRGS